MIKIRHGYGGKIKRVALYLLVFIVALAMPRLFAAPCESTVAPPDSLHAVTVAAEAESELDRLLSEFYSIMPEWIGKDTDVAGLLGITEIGSLLGNALSAVSGYFLNALALYVGVAALIAISELIVADSGNPEVLRAAVAICATVPLLRSFSSVLALASDGITSGCELFGGMIPLICSVVAIGGGTASAAASASSMSLSLSLISGVSSENLYPLSVIIFVSTAASSFDTGQGARRISKSLRTLFNFLLGAATTLLLSTVALQSVITSAKDSVALRGARYAIGSMLPAVSATVGATLGTLVSGASVISSTMGVSGVIALAATVGAPLLSVLSYRTALQLAVTFSGLFGADASERLLDSLRAALDLLISVLAAVLVVFVLEIVIFMKAVPS